MDGDDERRVRLLLLECVNGEPRPGDETVSWHVTKGHCRLITFPEMVCELIYDVTHTHTLSAQHTLTQTCPHTYRHTDTLTTASEDTVQVLLKKPEEHNFISGAETLDEPTFTEELTDL